MKILLTVLTALLMFSSQVHAKQKVTLLLDWFVNPDHAALIVAQQKGYFSAHDLDVEIIEPADPSMPHIAENLAEDEPNEQRRKTAAQPSL